MVIANTFEHLLYLAASMPCPTRGSRERIRGGVLLKLVESRRKSVRSAAESQRQPPATAYIQICTVLPIETDRSRSRARTRWRPETYRDLVTALEWKDRRSALPWTEEEEGPCQGQLTDSSGAANRGTGRAREKRARIADAVGRLHLAGLRQ